jgi:16S rRNA G966 N2-methylase RsmD
MVFMMRCYMGHLARTGQKMKIEEGKQWASTFDENPRLVVLWGQLRSIAEPTGLVVESAVGFGALAEKHGATQYEELKEACTCTCHERLGLQVAADSWMQDVRGNEDLLAWKMDPAKAACKCHGEALVPDSPTFAEAQAFACFARYALQVVSMVSVLPDRYKTINEDVCSYTFANLCVTDYGYAVKGLEGVLCHGSCPNFAVNNCPHMSCEKCLAVFGTDTCFACTIVTKRLQSRQAAAIRLATPVLVARYTVAETVGKIATYLNPHSKHGVLRPENHQLVMKAKAWMGMMELAFTDMHLSTWEPIAKIEAFLQAAAEPPSSQKVPVPDPLRNGVTGNDVSGIPGAKAHEPAALGARVNMPDSSSSPSDRSMRDRTSTVALARTAHDIEDDHMREFDSKYQMAYQKNKKESQVAHMTWQEYLRMLCSAEKGPSQQRYPLTKFDFIHIDPWYDALNHPDPRAMKNIRKLIDLISLLGTVVVVWGHYTNLADWERMFNNHYSKPDIETRWIVDPSLMCVIRHMRRNFVAVRGVAMKSMTEHFIVAIRVEPHVKQRNMMIVNLTGEAIELTGFYRSEDARVVPNANVVFEYLPPAKGYKLLDAKGKPLRNMSEKGPDINTQLLARFAPPGTKIFDMFGGTCSLGLSALLLDANHTYFALESDEKCIEPAQNRLGKASLLRARLRAEIRTTLETVSSFHELASGAHSFVLPESNVPQTLASGKALGTTPEANLDFVTPRTESQFEIKDTAIIVQDRPMGQGLFLRTGEATIPAGTILPSLSFYGKFVLASYLDALFPDGIPGWPGCFLMSKPLQQYALLVDERCPAAKINDPHSTSHYTFCVHLRGCS